MIEMHYEELSNTRFLHAVQKLASIPMKSPKVMSIMHITKHLQKHQDAMREAFQKDIVQRFAINGSAVEMPTGLSLELKLPFNAIAGKEQECKEAIDQFGKRKFTIPFKKLTVEDLISFGEWSAAELSLLEPICAPLALAEQAD